VQVVESADDLRGVEAGPRDVQPRLAPHVVNVELEVAPVHYRQHQAEGVLRLVSVGKIHDEPRIDLLQDLLLDQDHGLTLPLLYPLLLQLLARVHLPGRSHLKQEDVSDGRGRFSKRKRGRDSIPPSIFVPLTIIGLRTRRHLARSVKLNLELSF
jgi:hypothetical protein